MPKGFNPKEVQSKEVQSKELKRKRVDNTGESSQKHQELLRSFNRIEKEAFPMLIENALKSLKAARDRINGQSASQGVTFLTRRTTFKIDAYKKSIEEIESIKISEFDNGKFDGGKQKLQNLIEDGKKIDKVNDGQTENLTKQEFASMKAAEALENAIWDLPKQYWKEVDRLQSLVQDKDREIAGLKRSSEVKNILKRAKPASPPEVGVAFKQLQELHRRAKFSKEVLEDEHREVFEDEHRRVFENLLGQLSPETLQDYKSRGVEFVINPDPKAEVFWPEVEKNAENKLQLKLPTPYKYGIHGMVLRTIDLLLETEQKQSGDIPSPERRVEIATRVFQANDKLGDHGFSTKGYGLAEKYYKDYKNGIREAFENGLISKETPKEELMRIGYENAHNKYLESIQPTRDIPCIFPSMQPGAYFEECSIWEIHQGQQPVKVGSQEFDTLMQHLHTRKQKGENVALTVNILPNKDVLVQPYYILDGLRSRHPMNAGGWPSVVGGETNIEIDIETKEVTRLKDQSGHFRTFDKDHPDRMARFALEVFEELGYDTSTTMIELTLIEGAKDLEYHNYRPPTLANVKDSDWQTPSEKYTSDFWRERGSKDIAWDEVD